MAAKRLSCYFENFGTFSSSVETLVSFFLVLGPSLYFLYMTRKSKVYITLEKKYILAFLLTLAINTPIVMVATLARETRLFALPLVFLWPLAGQLFGRDLTLLTNWKLLMDCFGNWRYSLFLMALGIVSYVVAFRLYVPSFPSKDNFFNEYLFALLLIISLHFLLRTFLRKSFKTSQ